MVGNVDEWVADWVDRSELCADWTSQTGIPGHDLLCFGGNGTTLSEFDTQASYWIPGALVRGGSFATSTEGGLAAGGGNPGEYPSDFIDYIGFRCAR